METNESGKLEKFSLTKVVMKPLTHFNVATLFLSKLEQKIVNLGGKTLSGTFGEVS